MGLPPTKKSKASVNKDIQEVDVSSEPSIIDEIFSGVNKTSATKQIIVGATSGWVTGFLAMKVGKVIAFSVGGGIIALQIAANQGYVKINWDRIQKKAEKLTDRVEEEISGEGPKLLDKVERFVDKKLDKAEELIKAGKTQGRRWYHKFTNTKEPFRPREIHFFLASFAAGVAIGLATGN